MGDGNFHQIVMYNPSKADETASVKQCVDEMMHRALAMEGTVSVSHFEYQVAMEKR